MQKKKWRRKQHVTEVQTHTSEHLEDFINDLDAALFVCLFALIVLPFSMVEFSIKI